MTISREARDRGLRIREARRAYGRSVGLRLPQAEFALRLTRVMQDEGLLVHGPGRSGNVEIHQSAVSRWENGRTRPSLEEYEGMARLTGEDVCWLVFNIPSVANVQEYRPAEKPAKRNTSNDSRPKSTRGTARRRAR